MPNGPEPDIAHHDREDGHHRNGHEAPLWQRQSFLAATLGLVGISIVVLVFLLQTLAGQPESSLPPVEVAQQLEEEASVTIELRASVDALTAELQTATAREMELETAINEIMGERDSLKAELAAAADQRTSIEAERGELSEDLEQSQALVAQQKATIGLKTTEIARLSNRVSELERSEQPESATEALPGPVAGKDLTPEPPQRKPQKELQKRPQTAARSEGPDGPAEFLEALSGKVKQIYQSNGVAPEERKRRLRILLHESVDLTSMTKSILGSYWQSADSQERAKYLSLVEGYLFKPLIRVLEGDGVRGMRILETGPANESGTLVTTRLETLSGDAHKLGWRIRKQDNAFKAVDLRAEGVSLFNVYESELQSYADRNGVVALLETLEAKNQVLIGAAQRVPGGR